MNSRDVLSYPLLAQVCSRPAVLHLSLLGLVRQVNTEHRRQDQHTEETEQQHAGSAHRHPVTSGAALLQGLVPPTGPRHDGCGRSGSPTGENSYVSQTGDLSRGGEVTQEAAEPRGTRTSASTWILPVRHPTSARTWRLIKTFNPVIHALVQRCQL